MDDRFETDDSVRNERLLLASLAFEKTSKAIKSGQQAPSRLRGIQNNGNRLNKILSNSFHGGSGEMESTILLAAGQPSPVCLSADKVTSFPLSCPPHCH